MARRNIRLTFVESGESVLAELLDDEAPEVCRLVWDLLPIETKVVHGMYSGAEVFALLDDPQPCPSEALTKLPLPGELLYFYDESKNVTNVRKAVAELCIVYNRGVVLRGPEGVIDERRVVLADVRKLQEVEVDGHGVTRVTLRILSTYAGQKGTAASLAEVGFFAKQ